MAARGTAEPIPAATGARIHVRLAAVPLAVDAVRVLVADPGAGATVVMVGSTREATGAELTAALHYEAHEPLAQRLLEGILAAAAAAHSLAAAAIEHRLGRVAVGEASIVVAVAAAHRRAAFAAAEWIVDEVKRTVPIWKCDEAPDGSRRWAHPGDLRAVVAGEVR